MIDQVYPTKNIEDFILSQAKGKQEHQENPEVIGIYILSKLIHQNLLVDLHELLPLKILILKHSLKFIIKYTFVMSGQQLIQFL